MAEVDVKQKSSTESKPKQSDASIARQERSGSGIARGGSSDRFSVAPYDLLSGNPFSLMHRMSEEMDRAFGRLFGQAAGGGLSAWYPAVDVKEKDGQLQVHAELPGLKPEDVKVEVNDNSLVVRGERKHEHEENEGGIYRSERRYGQFYREIPLPEGANPEQAKAQFNNGVLEITLPVSERASNRRQIPIETKEV